MKLNRIGDLVLPHVLVINSKRAFAEGDSKVDEGGGGGGNTVVDEGHISCQSFLGQMNGSQLLAADITVQNHSIGEQSNDRSSFEYFLALDRRIRNRVRIAAQQDLRHWTDGT